jgi:hypothetical protein
MIHIATVHWNTDKWISVQQYYLQKHIKSPYRVYAWLHNIACPPGCFYYTCSEPIVSHAIKLNILADIIYFSSNRNDDILIFLDGDAFPIGDVELLIRQKLTQYKLLAVQRLENDGDIQPHPCFCATTVGFWQTIKGDWKEGYRWQNKDGRWISDIGGNLLKQLMDRGVDWYPLLRSNKKNLHPVFFAVYEGVIYHHGSGFRRTLTRFDRTIAKRRVLETLLLIAPRSYRRAFRQKQLTRVIAENSKLSEKVFKRIQQDPQFAREFFD